MTWKNLCVKHDYERRLSEVYTAAPTFAVRHMLQNASQFHETDTIGDSKDRRLSLAAKSYPSGSRSFDATTPGRPRLRSYKSHFKQRYLVEAAWRSGGESAHRNITQEGGVVTSLHITPKYIIMALDNAKIHVFDPAGNGQRTLSGHVMGVWAMVPWGETLVSGGCDRDVRVWDLESG